MPQLVYQNPVMGMLDYLDVQSFKTIVSNTILNHFFFIMAWDRLSTNKLCSILILEWDVNWDANPVSVPSRTSLLCLPQQCTLSI